MGVAASTLSLSSLASLTTGLAATPAIIPSSTVDTFSPSFSSGSFSVLNGRSSDAPDALTSFSSGSFSVLNGRSPDALTSFVEIPPVLPATSIGDTSPIVANAPSPTPASAALSGSADHVFPTYTFPPSFSKAPGFVTLASPALTGSNSNGSAIPTSTTTAWTTTTLAPTASSSARPELMNSNRYGLSKGAIIGAVIGAVLWLPITVLMLHCARRNGYLRGKPFHAAPNVDSRAPLTAEALERAIMKNREKSHQGMMVWPMG